MEKEENIALIEHRIAKVKESVLIGLTNKEIMDRFGLKTISNKPNKNYFGVSTRQIENYIAKAKEQIRESSNFDKTKELGQAIDRYNLIFKQALGSQKLRDAITANKELTGLLGLIQKQEIEKPETAINITRVYE